MGAGKSAKKLSGIMSKFAAVGVAVWDEDSCEYDEKKYEENYELAQLIAKELHKLSSSREQQQWNRRDNYHYDDRDEDYPDEDEESAYGENGEPIEQARDSSNGPAWPSADQRFQELQAEAREQQEEAYENALYEKLSSLCFRLERPYEHHNEMEQHMAYQERDRGDEYD